ncbi:MAG: hypothetical protein Q8O73_09050 [Thalassospira sp.]|nr:hypothetical protein [Thalassospira sp.]
MTAHNKTAKSAENLPVLDHEMGNRIRHVVDLFARKKDAAQTAGVIPEQLNRWCQAQSEPRFVGISRMAVQHDVRLDWIATGDGPIHTTDSALYAPHTGGQPAAHMERDVLMAIISGFLAAEGIQNAPAVVSDIVAAHDEILSTLPDRQPTGDYGTLISHLIVAIIDRYRARTGI